MNFIYFFIACQTLFWVSEIKQLSKTIYLEQTDSKISGCNKYLDMKQYNWAEGLGRATFGRVLMGSLSKETEVSLEGWDGSSHAKNQGKNDFYAKGTSA